MTRLFLIFYMLILTLVCTLLKLKALRIGVTTTTSRDEMIVDANYAVIHGEEIAQIG